MNPTPVIAIYLLRILPNSVPFRLAQPLILRYSRRATLPITP